MIDRDLDLTAILYDKEGKPITLRAKTHTWYDALKQVESFVQSAIDKDGMNAGNLVVSISRIREP
jgi:hypothetical protein